MKKILIILIVAFGSILGTEIRAQEIVTGAEQTERYIHELKGKRVGMVVNATSIIGKQLSVDTLQKLGINIQKIFAPEHGFRGDLAPKSKTVLTHKRA
jgi:uncharacterized protein YbbC (DUF1343 family)